MLLFQQDHLSRRNKLPGLDGVQVKSAGHQLASVILAVPGDAVCANSVLLVRELTDGPSKLVVDGDFHFAGVWHGELNSGFRIERIRVVLRQRKILGAGDRNFDDI